MFNKRRTMTMWGIVAVIIIFGVLLIFTPTIDCIIFFSICSGYIVGLIFILFHITVAKAYKYKIKKHVILIGILIVITMGMLMLSFILTNQLVVSNYKQTMLFINSRYITIFFYFLLYTLGIIAIITVPLVRKNLKFIIGELILKLVLSVVILRIGLLFFYWTAVIFYPFPTYETSEGEVEYILINMSQVSQKSYKNYPAYEVYFFNDKGELLNVGRYATYSTDMYLDVCDTVLENSNNVFSKDEFVSGNLEYISEIQNEEECNKRVEFKNNEVINVEEFK